jgi:dTDP-4-dehydrorhamnose 3,5-epimerase
MEFREIDIVGSYLFSPRIFEDNRGSFSESFKQDLFAGATGSQFSVSQINTSVSKAKTLRGIHTAEVPPGQAKYVMCSSGAIDDFVIDLRKGSPTFLTWQKINLDSNLRQAIFIPAGLGHGFVAKSDTTIVTYLCDYEFSPESEFGINPFDADLGVDWEIDSDQVIMSEKDRQAPNFYSEEIQSRLPIYGD